MIEGEAEAGSGHSGDRDGSETPRTAFVLSGGGSLGAVQVGMMQALCDRELRPDLLVGASAGALNAVYVAGRGFNAEVLEDLGDIWRSLRRKHLFPFAPHRQLLALTGARSSLCSNAGLRRLVGANLGVDRLEDALIPVHVVATEVTSGIETVLSDGDPLPAVLASAAIPAILPPVDIDGRTFFDGGVADNTPISQAVALGAERVVVLPTGYACDLDRPPRAALGVAVHALTLLIEQRLVAEVAAHDPRVELIVIPPLCPLEVPASDFSHADELISRARSDSERWLDEGGAHQPHQERFLSLHSHQSSGRSHTHSLLTT